jgi:hypothetical protein
MPTADPKDGPAIGAGADKHRQQPDRKPVGFRAGACVPITDRPEYAASRPKRAAGRTYEQAAISGAVEG